MSEGVWRELAPHALSRLLRTYGAAQFELCEDAVQEALLDAHRQWVDGVPLDPRAWITTVARRRYVDRIRVEARRRAREERTALLEAPLADARASDDDALLLLTLCCHPDLSRSGQVALTLRAVSGLTTQQIANAYQLPETTIAQRITRAKQRLERLGREFPRPDAPEERLTAVLDVLYVMFTEAHHTTTGAPAQDADLADEAIHLARLVRQAAPGSTEVAGLLALMVLTEARHPARVGPRGELVPLDEQDRSLWQRPLIAEGLAILDHVVPDAIPGPYLLQACIAGIHAAASSTEATDWSEIHALYTILERITGGRNPTIALNRIVAQAMTEGAEPALFALAELALAHPQLPRLHSVRAHLLERAGRTEDAVTAYRDAAGITLNTAERQYLVRRRRRLEEGLTGNRGGGDDDTPGR